MWCIWCKAVKHLSSWSKYSQVMFGGSQTSSSHITATILTPSLINLFLDQFSKPCFWSHRWLYSLTHWIFVPRVLISPADLGCNGEQWRSLSAFLQLPYLSPELAFTATTESLLCCWASLHFDSWIYSIIYESCNVLTSPANNVRIKEIHLKKEEILVTMSCHGMVVFSVHRPLSFNSIPCFPWFASLAFGSCPILARGGGSQWAGAPCTICTTHTN